MKRVKEFLESCCLLFVIGVLVLMIVAEELASLAIERFRASLKKTWARMKG